MALPFQLFSQTWEQGKGFQSRPILQPNGERAGFKLLDHQKTGVRFVNQLDGERGLRNQILLNGSGVAAGDVNGDGLSDLYFCGLDVSNALFLNQGGWNFKEVQDAGEASCSGQASTGAVFADVNGDGHLDLLVTGHRRGVRLFLNDGHAKFNEATQPWGLGGTSGGASMALADVDGDGWLDLYVVNYRNDTMRDMVNPQFEVRMENGEPRLISFNGKPGDDPDLKGRFTFDQANGVMENGEPDQLYLNRSGEGFDPVPWENGRFLDAAGKPVETPFDWGLSAMFCDINGDRAPDLYVCNDFQSPDRLWINLGDGRLRAADERVLRQTSLFSMGLDFADINRDGLMDFFVADMLSRSHLRRMVQVMDGTAFSQYRDSLSDRPQSPRNTLFVQRNNHTFSELARFAGVEASDWSWCPAFVDVDLDGYEDLLITTGHWRDAQNADVARELDAAMKNGDNSVARQLEMRRRFPILNTPNVAFQNNGDGTFNEIGSQWGFDSTQVSHGMALADLDNDGDLDVVINPLNAEALVYENQATNPRVRIQLRGERPNTAGVGGVIRVHAPGLPEQSQSIIAGGRYLSGDAPMRSFAVRETNDLITVSVNWRNGKSSVLEGLPANRLYILEEPRGKIDAATPSSVVGESIAPLFQDVSDRLNHQHFDTPYDDFIRQPLQPRKLSGLGPGVAWFDFNQDGWEDLFIGTGKGGRLGVFRNDGGKRFIRQRAKAFETPSTSDTSTILAWRPSSGELELLMAQCDYEDGPSKTSIVHQFSMTTGKMHALAGVMDGSIGPMCMADCDGDGDLDLFVGSRVRKGLYPQPSSGFLFRNENGELRPDDESGRVLQGVGMIRSAIFTDILGDILPELVLACEWGGLRVFENQGGRFEAWTGGIRLDPKKSHPAMQNTFATLNGWWTSIQSVDLDGDGRLDLIAGNWGRNHERAHQSHLPLQIHFGGPGGLIILESYRDNDLGAQVPGRDWGALSTVLPWLQGRFPSFTRFGQASMEEVVKSVPVPIQTLEAGIFDSVVLLNRNGFFELKPLPQEAQQAPLFGMGAGDFNGDGHEDLVVTQNFFGVSPLDSRQDAGCGLVLLGRGDGSFSALDPLSSGLTLFGEGRGLAVADFDQDRRPDFVAAQNKGPTGLYRNVSGNPGFGVRLIGGPKNPQAIGAKARLVYEDGSKGPVREWRLGDGYWSQSPNRRILGMRSQPTFLEVQWSSGVTDRISIEDNQTELIVSELIN